MHSFQQPGPCFKEGIHSKLRQQEGAGVLGQMQIFTLASTRAAHASSFHCGSLDAKIMHRRKLWSMASDIVSDRCLRRHVRTLASLPQNFCGTRSSAITQHVFGNDEFIPSEIVAPLAKSRLNMARGVEIIGVEKPSSVRQLHCCGKYGSLPGTHHHRGIPPLNMW